MTLKITFNKVFNIPIKALLTSVLVLISALSHSQQKMNVTEGITVSCPMGEEDANSRHGAAFLGTSFEDILNRNPTAEFNVTLGQDLQQQPDAIAAFQFAIDIWSREIVSSVPINIFVDFRALGSDVLAQAGPAYFVSNFPNAPLNSISYPAALANALAGEVLLPNQPSDLNVSLNSSVNFYLGTDGNTPESQFDFVTVALHEIGHGLGFLAAPNRSGTEASLALATEFPIPYTNFITDGNNVRALDIEDPSTELLAYLTSDNLFFEGQSATEAFSGVNPKIEAPSLFSGGSSISHLDEEVFSIGDANSLMTPIIGMSESLFDIGDITRGVLKDIGWELNDSSLFSLSVNEAIGDLEVNQGGNGAQTILVTNESDQAFTYNAVISNNPQNVSITLNNATNIKLEPGEQQEVTILYNTAELDVDLYQAEISISTNVSPIEITRDLRINILNEAAVALINTVAQITEEVDVLVFSFENAFRINNTGSRILDYSIAVEDESSPFITLNNPTGFIFENSFAEIDYVINSDLPEGEYTANLRIISNASNTPNFILPVVLTIRDFPKPSFEIDIENPVDVFIDVDSRDPAARVSFSVTNTGELPLEFDLESNVNDIFLLSTLRSGGTVPPGETLDRSFIVTAGIGAVDNNYSSTITFTSNDPVIPELTIPLNITLSRQRGRLALLESPSFSTSIEAGTSEIRALQFENIGLEPVSIESIESLRSNTQIISTSLPNGSILNVGETLTVVTQFSPNGRIGSVNQGIIQINNNGTPANLQGTNSYSFSTFVEAPSGLSVSQSDIYEVLNLNSNTENFEPVRFKEITITNHEEIPLDFNVSLDNPLDVIFSISTTEGRLDAGESETIILTVNGSEQEAGFFENRIRINTTSPEISELVISASLEVINPVGFFNENPVVDVFVEDGIAFGFVELTNTSSAPIEISSVTTANPDALLEITSLINDDVLSGDNFILQPNQSLVIDFALQATVNNTINDQIIINSNAVVSELFLPVIFGSEEIEIPTPVNNPSTFGPEPIVDIFVEDGIAFGSVELLNTGETPITISEIVTQNSYEFSDVFILLNEEEFSSENSQLLPNEMLFVEFELQLDADSSDFLNDNLIVRSDASVSELLVPLVFGDVPTPVNNPSTFGPEPIVDIFVEDGIAFGSVELLNTGETPITISEIVTQNSYEFSDVFILLNEEEFSSENSQLLPNEMLFVEFELQLDADSSDFLNDNLIVRSDASVSELLVPLVSEDAVLSINDIEISKNQIESFSVAPNPIVSETHFQIPFSNLKDIVVDLKNLSQQSLNTKNRVTIDSNGNGNLIMDGLQSGIYILTLKNKNTGVLYVSKVLKK